MMSTSNGTLLKNGTNGTISVEKEDNRLFIMPIKWLNVSILASIHFSVLFGACYYIFHPVYWTTSIFQIIYGYYGGFGVTGGVHRLWTHKAYKANTALKIILASGYLCTGMNPIFEWVRDHRVHHKFSDTDADPHNAKRGLFFSHCGWLLQKKHPEVVRRGKEIDMSDVLSDPVFAFVQKYFFYLMPIFTFIIPTLVPPLCWGETWDGSFYTTIFRWVTFLNIVWSVNSFAHAYGYKPYNKKIRPSQNIFVSLFALGEGWHNYHHVFPWDYKTAELPYYFNLTTILIDCFAAIGWAYDLKHASKNLIKQCVINSCDDKQYHKWNKELQYEKEE